MMTEVLQETTRSQNDVGGTLQPLPDALMVFFEQSRDPIYMTNRASEIIAVNQAAVDLFGYTRTEIIGLDTGRLYAYPVDWDRFQQEIAQNQSVIDYEVELRKKDGTPIDCLFTATARKRDDGHIMGYQGIIRDITERKRLEKEILEISEREQRRIGQDLHDDLGQNLTGIAFLSKVLEQKLAARSLADEAETAAQIATLINQAIGQTRDLARGLVPVELEENGLMSALQTLASNVENQSGISCLFKCDTSVLIHDNTTATHLYRIAQEAVHNAVKHGQAKQIVINLADINSEIMLMVKDDGVGFPESLENKKGMGVRMMHYRARLIGGSLEIRRSIDDETLVVCSIQTSTDSPTETRTVENVRILIVEDEAPVAYTIQMMLERLGYTVVAIVSSGEEGIQQVTETYLDLVLMDIVLKGEMNGMEAAAQIHSRFNIPVVYLTGHADDDTLRQAALTEPFWGYLLKPFDIKELDAAVKIALFKSYARLKKH